MTRSPSATLPLACLAALWAALACSPAAAGEPVSQGDRVVFLGDSITQSGDRPGGYVALAREALAKRGVEVIGAGISGNRVPDIEKRLDRDVLEREPTVVVIYIGINDVWRLEKGRGTPRDEYEAGLRRVVARTREAGARVVLCTPSVIGEKTDGSNPLDETLDAYCEVSRTVAREAGVELLDLRSLFLARLGEINMENAEKNVLTTDGVHLNPAGNRFVSARMVEALTGRSRVLRHVVLFKFKDDVPPEHVQEVVDAFAALPGKIDTIVDFEHGTDVSVEGKADGFTHGFVVSFASAKGREIYLPHPAHQEFVKLVGPRLDKVLVFDYWTAE